MHANRVIGVLRFSYPAMAGFGASDMPAPELEAHLYDEARLERRFAYLETLTLPSLAAQTDGDFTCVIVAGQSLPDHHKARLRDLCAEHPFLHVEFLDRLHGFAAAKRAFRRAAGEGASHVTGFRIDDDDAVATDYVARTRDLADRALAAGLAERPLVVAFARGLYWNLRVPAAPFWEVRETRPLGLACAMITAADIPTCIYRYNHRRLPAFVPTLMEPDGLAFIRTLHGHNDSRSGVPPGATAVPQPEARRLLATRFGLDADRALALMPLPTDEG